MSSFLAHPSTYRVWQDVMSTTSGRRHNSDVDHEKDGRQSASRRRQGVTIKCDAVV